GRGIDAGVNARIGGGRGVNADLNALTGGSDGIDANATASVGGGNGVDADLAIGRVDGAGSRLQRPARQESPPEAEISAQRTSILRCSLTG
ncbi:hypothetical protein AB9F34_33525, partial [Rhizobium leguminosarum]